MICSSVNLDRFIRPSLPSGRTLRIFGGASGGQVTVIRQGETAVALRVAQVLNELADELEQGGAL
jgi:hypothetical protein